ncbi:MAG: DEAD/DEAH box helicase, partial [Turicibacter sp.]
MTERFQDLNIKPYLKDAIADLHFETLTQIQSEVIPLALQKKDIIGQSQTGSGKTHSFLLPIFQQLDEELHAVQAVITTPTRELAEQIYQVASHLASFSDKAIKISRFVGGTDKQKSIDKLGVQPQIVIGTPGRIKDLAINERALQVHTAKMFVIDEADMTLETGFLTDIDQIAGTMAKNLQMMVFSATIPQGLKPFLKKYMSSPTHIHIQPRQQTAVKIEHILYPTKHRSRVNIVANLLKTINPYLAIIFVNTKQHASDLANSLMSQGITVGQMHGDLTPRQRRQMMQRIRNLEFQYIVATDIAARGIDIDGISHIINYELPQDLEFYIHRVGRTARGSNKGIAITLYDTKEENLLVELEQRGIEFKYKEIKDGEFVTVNARNARQKRDKALGMDELDKLAIAKVRKPKKVSPGYKKKMKTQMERVKQKERRKR